MATMPPMKTKSRGGLKSPDSLILVEVASDVEDIEVAVDVNVDEVVEVSVDVDGDELVEVSVDVNGDEVVEESVGVD